MNLLCCHTLDLVVNTLHRGHLTRKLTEINSIFFLSLSLSLQKWKPKGSALQHLVSGLCLDSQTPTGPPVINQCRPQVASQSWEPQIITWVDGGEGEGEADSGPDPVEGLCIAASLRDDWSDSCTFVMSDLCLGDKSIAENIQGPCREKYSRSFVYRASSSRMLQFCVS